MKEKKLIGNIILFSIMPRINSILSLLIFPLITPFLTEKDFGLWGLISSYYAIAFAISTLGLEVNFVNTYFVYKRHFRFPWRILSGIIHYSGIIFSLLFALLMYVVLPDLEHKIILVCLASLPIFFQNISKIPVQLLILRERALPISYRTAIAAFFSVGITWLLISVFKLGFWGWVVAYFVNALIIYLSFIRFLYFNEKILPSLKISLSRISRFLSVSIPLIPHALALVILSSSDRIIMDILQIEIDEIGFYSLGYRMANYMFTIVAGFIAALTPRLQLFYRKNQHKKFSSTIWMSYSAIMLITLLGSTWMQEIFYLLVRNPNLHAAAPLGSIAIFASSFHIWYFTVTMPLLIQEKTKLLPWTIVIPALINILFNFLAIPIWGYKAALYTTYFCYMITPFTGLMFPRIRKYITQMMPDFKKNIILVAVFNTFLLILSLFIIKTSYGIRIVISLAYLIIFGWLIVRQYLNLNSSVKKIN